MSGPPAKEARIEAAERAVMFYAGVTTCTPRFLAEKVLAGADAVERPAVERLVAALRELVEMDQPPHGFPDSQCPICDARANARAALAEFGQATNGRRTRMKMTSESTEEN